MTGIMEINMIIYQIYLIRGYISAETVRYNLEISAAKKNRYVYLTNIQQKELFLTAFLIRILLKKLYYKRVDIAGQNNKFAV